MTIRCETTPEMDGTGRVWQTYAGTNLTIHVPQGSSRAERAPEELRKAEQVVEALRKLLTPPEERAWEPVDIYLMDSMDPAPEAFSGAGSNGNGRERPKERPGDAPILSTVHPEAAGEPLARPLTRHLVARWFGPDAASATLFVEGLAGLAAAQIGAGPTVEEADRGVQAEIEAGRPVSVVARQRPDRSASEAAALAGFDPAATSFLAFLTAHSDPEALHRYLSAYDLHRQDQAALAAYHQPLAVLEEEWLAKLRRHNGNGDSLRAFLRQILPLLKPYRWKQLEILVYLLLAAAFNIVQPYAIKIFIDRLTAQVHNNPGAQQAGELFLKTLAPFLLLLLGIYILNGLVSLRRAYTVNWLNQNILNSLQVRMYAHLQRLSHNFYVNARIGDIMARLNDDLDNVQSALSQVTNKALYQSFTVVGALTALFLLTRKSPELAIPILCLVPLFAVNYVALRTRNKQASREQRKRVGQTMAAVQENLSAHAVIKAFGMEAHTLTDYRSRIRALQRSKLRLALLSALSDLSEDMITALAQLIIFGVGGYLVLRDGRNSLGIGDLTALLVLVKSIFSPIASLSGIGQTMQQATGAMERVTELFQEPITIADRPGAVLLPPLARAIRFENVTFRYDGKRPALRDLTLTIPAQAHVAVVGPSGAGKSTLVSLLLRFWDPEQGRILFDDHDLRDVTLASLRGQIGLVFQETFIFNTTLRANIAIGRPEATDAEIAAAAKAAQLANFIEALPAGYDTVPGENGARLSVGQKQRIAIARAFLRNPPLLILDEATSALDAKTEAGILETLSELAKGRTTISITHRISQAAAADRIFVLDAGRLVAQGTHEELVQAGGLYRKLYEEATGFMTNGVHPPAAMNAA
jgi:ABC-type multidrug transport system fused ATPase/permease subunit